jgi:hypothetical protein
LFAGLAGKGQLEGNIFFRTEAQSVANGHVWDFAFGRRGCHHGSANKNQDLERRAVSVGIGKPSANGHAGCVDTGDIIDAGREPPREPQTSGACRLYPDARA